jgi:cytochrome c peroxidase
LNNGVIGVAGSPGEIDLFNTRAPTLRDLVNPQGLVNGPLMHNAQFTSLEQVIDHYNLIPQNPANTNLDLRLQGPGSNLGLTPEEKSALVAFLRTLSGTNVYTDERWSDPFDANGNVTLIGGSAQVISHSPVELSVYPNTAIDEVNVHAAAGTYTMSVFSMTGSKVYSGTFTNHTKLDVRSWKSGIYVFQIRDEKGRTFKRKVIKD